MASNIIILIFSVTLPADMIPTMSSTKKHAKPAIFGPELPPSMTQSKAAESSSDTRELLNGTGSDTAEPFDLGMAMNYMSRDDLCKSDMMRRTEADLQRLVYSRLVSIMAGHGFKENTFTEDDMADVMVARGLMKTSSGDPVLALASELKEELTEIIYTNMRQILSSAFESGELTKMASEFTDEDRRGDAECDFWNSDEDTDASPRSKSIMRLIKSEMLKGSTKGIATMTIEADLRESASQDLPAATGSKGADAPIDASVNAASAQKKKKKKNKKKKSKSKVAQVEEEDDAAEATKADQPSLCIANSEDAAAGAECTASSPKQLSKMAPQKSPLPAVKQEDSTPASESYTPFSLKWYRDVVLNWDSSGKSPAPASSFSGSYASKRADNPGMEVPKDYVDEQKGLRKFWLYMHDSNRQALWLLEKHIVTCRVREHPNFSCPCNVCTRKRQAIELELESLYEFYFKCVEKSTRRAQLQELINLSDDNIRLSLNSLFDKATKVFSRRHSNSSKEEKIEIYRKVFTDFSKAIKTSKLQSPSIQTPLSTVDCLKEGEQTQPQEDAGSTTRAYTADMIFSLIDQNAPIFDDVALDVLGFGEIPFDWNDPSQPFNNSDIFYTDSMLDIIETYPKESKKLFDRLERLAEYRMREEDAVIFDEDDDDDDNDDDDEDYDGYERDAGNDNPYRHNTSSVQEPTQHSKTTRQPSLCPECHGHISEHEDQQPYSDAEDRAVTNHGSRKRARSQSSARNNRLVTYENKESGAVGYELGEDLDDEDMDDEYIEDYVGDSDSDGDLCCDMDDDEDDEDDDIHCDETDDDLDDMDPEAAESEAEETRKIFLFYIARMFEQRLLEAYREKVVRDRQRDLIEELEAEEKRSLAKEKRKQKKKMREKEKKRQIQQQKEEERQAKEAIARAEQERKREAEKTRLLEQEKRKEKEAAKARKVLEERNRRILEEADKRLEREKRERLQREQERVERQDREAGERARRESEASKMAKKKEQQVKSLIKEHTTNVLAESAPKSSLRKPSEPTPSLPSADTSAINVNDTQLSDDTDLDKAPPPQHPLPPPPPLLAMPNSAPIVLTTAPFLGGCAPATTTDGMPLLDSLQHMSVHTPSSSTSAQRPSLPSIHPFELQSASPTIQSLSPSRARSNSNSTGFCHVGPAPSTSAVASLELDAEITSIVGRVMGSSTLQGDLTEGAEWRTEPMTDGLLESPCTAVPLSGRSAVAANVGSSLASLSDMSIRRNSMPLNRAENTVGTSVSGTSIGMLSSPLMLDRDTEGIYAAYCALERFKGDKVQNSAESGFGKLGGYHSAADISQMHGMITERTVWNICTQLAQSNPSKCNLDHAVRSVAFALDMTANPAAPADPKAPALAEDTLNAFSLQSCSPMLKSQQPASATTPTRVTMPPPVPIELANQSMLQSLAQQQQLGLNYSPVARQSPTSIFFSPLATQAGGGGGGSLHSTALPFSLPPFQPSPLNGAGFGQRMSSANGSPTAPSMLQPSASSLLLTSHPQSIVTAAAKPVSAAASDLWSLGKPSDSLTQSMQNLSMAPFHSLNASPHQASHGFQQLQQQLQQQQPQRQLQQWQ
ncbi:Stress response protein nst1 [Coemansia spiralis]|uniref:Stress response protein NST1 n=1 Tax=Coemansia spiralis TaxID=417178 RepID=A0A9W8G875_9FUNG|nr:Stress response protein nst1 [Coemansia spiralis]